MVKDGVEISENATRINGNKYIYFIILLCLLTYFNNLGLAVSRALGDHFVKENNMGMSSVPHVSECYELTEEDTLLVVASDGVSNITKVVDSVY